MNSTLRTRERGFSPAIIIIPVVVIGIVGALAYVYFTKINTTPKASSALEIAIQEAAKKCDIDDKDICKFYGSWKVSKQYRVTSVSTTDGVKTTSLYEVDGDKTYMKSDGENGYEVISIDKTTYTKAGDTWWKQTAKPAVDLPAENVTSPENDSFDDPTSSATEQKTTYKKLGKEACGNLQCFKYQVINSTQTDPTDIIYFDDKEYQLRKMTSESAGSLTEQTFEYGNVSIKVPSPVRELAENQYIIPGQSEPATVPGMGAVEQ